jgi:hypothetical protein
MNKNKQLVEPAYRTPKQLGARWQCHPLTVIRRMKQHGVMPMKLTQRSVLYRMSDVERIERACLT